MNTGISCLAVALALSPAFTGHARAANGAIAAAMLKDAAAAARRLEAQRQQACDGAKDRAACLRALAERDRRRLAKA